MTKHHRDFYMYVNNSIACGRVKNMTHRSLGLYDINCIAGERMHNTNTAS